MRRGWKSKMMMQIKKNFYKLRFSPCHLMTPLMPHFFIPPSSIYNFISTFYLLLKHYFASFHFTFAKGENFGRKIQKVLIGCHMSHSLFPLNTYLSLSLHHLPSTVTFGTSSIVTLVLPSKKVLW